MLTNAELAVPKDQDGATMETTEAANRLLLVFTIYRGVGVLTYDRRSQSQQDTPQILQRQDKPCKWQRASLVALPANSGICERAQLQDCLGVRNFRDFLRGGLELSRKN